jgi:hypothetical protein
MGTTEDRVKKSERAWTPWRVGAVAGLALAYLSACVLSFVGGLLTLGGAQAASPPAAKGYLPNLPILHSEIQIHTPSIAAFWLLHVCFLVVGVKWLRQRPSQRPSELNLFMAFASVTLVGGWTLAMLASRSHIRIDWLTLW